MVWCHKIAELVVLSVWCDCSKHDSLQLAIFRVPHRLLLLERCLDGGSLFTVVFHEHHEHMLDEREDRYDKRHPRTLLSGIKPISERPSINELNKNETMVSKAEVFRVR